MEKHDTLLLACANKENRTHLRSILEQRFNLLEAQNVPQALLLLQQNIDCICAVLVDTSIRSLEDKLDLMSEEAMAYLNQVPVIVTCSDDVTQEELSTFFRFGAYDVIPLHYASFAMLQRIETITDLHLHKRHLESIVQKQSDILRHSSERVVDALSSIIECRSAESGNHILRVRSFTHILLTEVCQHYPEYGLDERQIAIISSASSLHDVGKIAIPDAILTKPGKPTPEEWERMKTHPVTGCHILNNLKGSVEEEYLRYAYNICRYHHERWDGMGYPDGLRGDEIPICAQVAGLADAYDALTNDRSYKQAYPADVAVNMILKGECGAFSPRLLECFKNVTGQMAHLSQEYADGRSSKDSPFDMTLPPPDPNRSSTLDRTLALYYSLVHYLGVFLVEVDLSQQVFHVVYNPYPELIPLQNVTSLPELKDLLLDHIVLPEEREKMQRILFQDIPRFVEESMRRRTYRFHYQTPAGKKQGLFEMTLLRPGSASQPHRSLAILCRKITDAAGVSLPQEQQDIRLPEGAFCCRNDAQFSLVYMDGTTQDLGGYSHQELLEVYGGQLIQLIHPEDQEMVRSEFDRQLKKGVLVQLDHRVVAKDGSTIWVANKSRLVRNAQGDEFLITSLSDITGSMADLEQLRERVNRYEVILTQSENVLFEWDIRTDKLVFSDTWDQVFRGIPRSESMHSVLQDGSFFHPDDMPLLADCIHRLENGSNFEVTEVRMAAHQGRYIWCRFRGTLQRDREGRPKKVVGIIININAEKQAQRLLQDKADRDSLTKLLNKAAGRKHAEDYLSQFPEGIPCALLFIDLDDFKKVNDVYGHLFGDAVLTRAARSIEKHFQPQDIISRIGGDEFMVLVRGMANRNLLETRCRDLISDLRRVFQEGNKQILSSCSIGIALGPEHGQNYYDLFHHADQALYQAKAQGKNTCCFYSPQDVPVPLSSTRDTAISAPIDSDEQLGLAEDNLVQSVFRRLYTATNVNEAINESIALLGKAMNVSRVYVFENMEDDRFCRNTFEWCNEGIQPEIHNLQQVNYSDMIPGYQDNFNENGIFYCPDVAVLPQPSYDIVASQGILSMLQCAILRRGRFLGFIGFDECIQQRLWSKEEIKMLSYFSEVLATFLLKYRDQERIRIQAEELETILDNQNSWVYIIDPDTMKLKYRNRKARALASADGDQCLCYKTQFGRFDPCPGCPAAHIREQRSARSVLTDERFGSHILVEASMIRWQGEESCLITCHTMPSES